MLHLRFTILIETFVLFLIIHFWLHRWPTIFASSIILISQLWRRYSKLHLIGLAYRIFITIIAKISFQISCPKSSATCILLFILIKRKFSCSISSRILCPRRISLRTFVCTCRHSISAYLSPG